MENNKYLENEPNNPHLKYFVELKPIGHRVVIEADPPREISHGKIVMPDDNKKMAQYITGKIVKLGPTAFDWLDGENKKFCIGTRITCTKNAGFALSEAGQDGFRLGNCLYMLVNDEDIALEMGVCDE